jgi:heme oxygenase
MSAFAEIYLTFECEWTSIISCAAEVTETTVSPRIQNLLRALYDPSLLRTARLEHDLHILPLQQANHNILPSFPTLASQISHRIVCRPHTLLAYTWIMYLALFNGGRWIRSRLLSASASASASAPQFWPGRHTAEECLTFWHFDGDRDGEDIKDKFKARFEAVAAQLSEREKAQIVEEAVEVFQICGTVVEHLDRVFDAGADEKQENNNKREQDKPVSYWSPLLSLPFLASLTSQL